MGELHEVDPATAENVFEVFRELKRIETEATCKSCAYYEAPIRGGHRHCCLNMKPAPGGNDWCDEHEPRLKKTRAGQKQLPLGLKQG